LGDGERFAGLDDGVVRRLRLTVVLGDIEVDVKGLN
jgi:hypothetical protein